MAVTKESIKSAIDQLQERDLAKVYQLICELRDVHQKSSGERMAEVLQRMANRNALAHITDPVEWQREMREDRPLPGRE